MKRVLPAAHSPLLPAVVFILLLVSACAPRRALVQIPVVSPQQAAELTDRLEPLLVHGYEPPTRLSDALTDFTSLGCVEEWVQERNFESDRRAQAAALVARHPGAVWAIRQLKTPKSNFVLAALTLYTDSRDPDLLTEKEAWEAVTQAAEQGHPHAQYAVAERMMRAFPYFDNIPGDPGKFFEINRRLEAAALGGSGKAAHHLALRTQAHVLAKFAGHLPGSAEQKGKIAWAARSAELGDPGGMEFYAKFGELNRRDSVTWLKAAADAGNAHANYDLARNYQLGQKGVVKELDQARRYHCRAIYFGNQWSVRALKELAGVAEERWHAPVVKTLPPASLPVEVGIDPALSRSEREAQERLFVLLERIDPRGRPVLSNIENGGCSPDIRARALEIQQAWETPGGARRRKLAAFIRENAALIEKMKSSDNARSLYLIGRLLQEDAFPPPLERDEPPFPERDRPLQPKPETTALFWIRRAAEKGYGPAELAIVREDEKGKNVKQIDWIRRVGLMKKAAEAGSATAAYDMGRYYGASVYGMLGKPGFTPLADRVEVRRWNCFAADLGHVPAALECGSNYKNGVGGASNRRLAEKYFRQAADAGSGPGYAALAALYRMDKSDPESLRKANEHECLANLYGRAVAVRP